MARIPIEIEKIKRTYRNVFLKDNIERESTEYLISVTEKGQNWNKTFRCDLKELTKLRDEISELIESTTTAEKLDITNDKANILDKHFADDELCQNCNYKLTNHCLTCIFDLQSPLERKLFLALNKNYIRFEAQYPLNWKGENITIAGKTYNNPKNNFKEVLTVVDFYIEKKDVKLCIYTDGHTYHERTEEQAQRDKRIDRKLQELGFQVLRYTGKDVNECTEIIVEEIKKWIEKPTYKTG
ncbi:endonuclease domain-containing protein [Mariniflexile aquimaris]|uniref:Endonuclease domain-containing protein n=1 Tax=Mariniflexile aquimaris TaxID=881009 RepID=A0ABW3BUR6_9FLAO